MAVLNIACHHDFRVSASGGQLLSFVDNWHALANTPEALISSRDAVTAFARAWDLPIDASKTVVWSTSAKGRRALRDAGFQVTLDFRELGAHLASSRRGTNFTQTERIQALEHKWPRLGASLSPFAHKVRALGTAAWPAALHGISVSPLGDRHFVQLRSNAMKAIGLRAPGANPMVQLSLVGHSVNDPQFYALQSTFRDAKFLAGKEALSPLLTEVRPSGPGPCLGRRSCSACSSTGRTGSNKPLHGDQPLRVSTRRILTSLALFSGNFPRKPSGCPLMELSSPTMP